MKKADGLNKAIGETVKELRLERNMSQEKLAEKCDSSVVYISEIERGIKNPTATTLMNIALSFEIKMSELIKKVEERISY